MNREKSTSFWWGVYDDICAQISTIMLIMIIWALIRGLNTIQDGFLEAFAPLILILLFVLPFWAISSTIRRNG